MAIADLHHPTATAENTSGQGPDAVVPPEIQHWNLGAFVFSDLWLVGNGMLDEKIFAAMRQREPRIHGFRSVYLGSHGNELAWKYKQWPSIEAFEKSERRWRLAAGLFLGLSGLAILFVMALLYLRLAG